MNCFVCHIGVLTNIQKFFEISDSTAALLQTGMMMVFFDRHTQTYFEGPHFTLHYLRLT